MATGINHTTKDRVIWPYYKSAVAFTILAIFFFLPVVVFTKDTYPVLAPGLLASGVAIIDAAIIVSGRRKDQDIGDTLSFTVPLEKGNVNEAYAAKIGQLESYLNQRRLSFRKGAAPNPDGLAFLPDTLFELPGYGVTAKVRYYLEPSVMIGARIFIGRVSDPPSAGHLKLADDFRRELLKPNGYSQIIPGLELRFPDRNQ